MTIIKFRVNCQVFKNTCIKVNDFLECSALFHSFSGLAFFQVIKYKSHFYIISKPFIKGLVQSRRILPKAGVSSKNRKRNIAKAGVSKTRRKSLKGRASSERKWRKISQTLSEWGFFLKWMFTLSKKLALFRKFLKILNYEKFNIISACKFSSP